MGIIMGTPIVVNLLNSELDKKTEKVEIDYLGNKSFRIKGSSDDLTYKAIRDLLKESPNFVLMIHGNREHRCTMIDDESNPRQMRFVAPVLSDGVLKIQSIYVTSNDGVNITDVTVSNINSENQSNKIQEITEQIKGSTNQYPSVKAVYDFVEQEIIDKADVTEFNTELDTKADAITTEQVLKSVNRKANAVFKKLQGQELDLESVEESGINNAPSGAEFLVSMKSEARPNRRLRMGISCLKMDTPI